MFGKHPYRVWSLTSSVPAVRSIEGSSAVFVMSLAAHTLAVAISPITLTAPGFLKLLAIAAACTLAEALSSHGWDNATMQIIPSALFQIWMV
jgi:hypothetical protein